MPDDGREATSKGVREHTSIKRRLETVVGHHLRRLGVYRAIERPYFLAHFLFYRLLDMLVGRYRGSPTSTEGFYRIAPPIDGVEPYWYHLNVGRKHRRRRIEGTYERAVMRTLAEHIRPGSTFWEVGAYGGYFSLAFARTAERVVAFDADDRALSRLRSGAQENGFENVVTVNTTLGVEDSLDDYVESEQPDVVLIDIEGWEYEVLRSADRLLESKPIIVVELHAPGTGWSEGRESRPDAAPAAESVPPDTVDPQGVIDTLEVAGYAVSEVQRRRASNWHVVAVP